MTFEFDKNGIVTPGRTAVPITNGNSASQLATAIETAINNTTLTLDITARVGSTANTNFVDLTNTRQGTFGNQGISDTVVTTRFTVTPMAGGRGVDCAAGIGCTKDADCEPSLVCLPEGTCGTAP